MPGCCESRRKCKKCCCVVFVNIFCWIVFIILLPIILLIGIAGAMARLCLGPNCFSDAMAYTISWTLEKTDPRSLIDNNRGRNYLARKCYDNTVFYASDTHKSVYITIDDVPCDPEKMHELLDVLKKHNAQVSLFIIETFARTPEAKAVLERCVAEGHLLCNHWKYDAGWWLLATFCYCHCKPCDRRSRKIRRGIEKTKELILDVDPQNQCRFFRAPGGLLTPSVKKVVDEYEMVHILGDLFFNDVVVRKPHFHVDCLKRTIQPGSIMILHAPDPERRREQTIEILDEFIPWLQKEGFQLCTLDELPIEDVMNSQPSIELTSEEIEAYGHSLKQPTLSDKTIETSTSNVLPMEPLEEPEANSIKIEIHETTSTDV